jgi:hypothetical protein
MMGRAFKCRPCSRRVGNNAESKGWRHRHLDPLVNTDIMEGSSVQCSQKVARQQRAADGRDTLVAVGATSNASRGRHPCDGVAT